MSRTGARIFMLPPLPRLGRFGLPACRVPQARGLDDLQREQRALQARRGDVDPEQVEHEVSIELEQLLDRHPDQFVGGHRGRRLGDRAAVAGEGDVGDLAVLADPDLDLELVAAQRVRVEELHVRVVQLGLGWAPIVRALVVLEDVLAIQIVHQAKISWTVPSPSMRRSTSSRVAWTANEARVEAGMPSRRISG